MDGTRHGSETETATCLFCAIAAESLPADVVFRDAEVVAFRDIRPAAPVHILVIPVRHVASLDSVGPDDWALVTHLLDTTAAVAKQLGLGTNGYRVVTNVGRDGGQSVAHLHWHLLGGRPLDWPPG